MGKRLSDNLSSLYIGASNKLKSKKAKKKIVKAKRKIAFTIKNKRLRIYKIPFKSK